MTPHDRHAGCLALSAMLRRVLDARYEMMRAAIVARRIADQCDIPLPIGYAGWEDSNVLWDALWMLEEWGEAGYELWDGLDEDD